MAAVGQLSPQPWMTATATRAVMEALHVEGREARFVGGCVRDGILKRPVTDVDIATPLPPEEGVERLSRAGIKVIPTGITHGTVTAVVDGTSFEITTLRKDVACDGRHAQVAFTDDWRQDAARRDFTINAMSAGIDGTIHDYFNGLRDLGEGKVRFVGNPKDRIGEDVLRLLRFFRFFAWYGKPPADAAALTACRLLAPELASLSGERVRNELLKILMSPDPASVFLLMRGERVLERVLPEAFDFGRLRVLSWLETRGIREPDVEPDVLRRLAAAIRTDEAGVLAMSSRLKLSNRQTMRLAGLVACPTEFSPDPDMEQRACRRALYHLGVERMRDLILIAWAEQKATAPTSQPSKTEGWLKLLTAARTWTPPEFPIRGRDLLAAGVVPAGPALGRCLKDLKQWWEEGDYQAGREEILAQARRTAG
ncbi:MAG: CCA tRNA nucleotidyltransferase [Alphaproteobacteria bacterium]